MTCDGKEQHYKELLILKTIAETLNRSQELKPMLQSTLEKLLEAMGLRTGWIFLIDEEPVYRNIADYNLPPALSIEDKRPMACGSCWCLGLYWAGELNHAVNILECKRLMDAVACSWGDTHNLTHRVCYPSRTKRFVVPNLSTTHRLPTFNTLTR